MNDYPYFPISPIYSSDTRYLASKDIINCSENYFPFGRERSRLAHYVQEQLHGNSTRKNEEILVRFRQEAEIRKHHRLHGRRYASLPDVEQKQQYRYNTIEIQPQLEDAETLQQRFSNYIPREFRSPSLQPTPKIKPPAFSYDAHEPNLQQVKKSNSPRFKQTKQSLSSFLGRTTKKQGTKFSFIYPQQVKASKDIYKKSRSVEQSKLSTIEPTYRDNALKKIKEIAKTKRIHPNLQDNPETQNIDTDSSQMVEELELQAQKSKVEYKHLSKQLKRLKKYRKIIRNHQNLESRAKCIGQME